MDGERTSEAAAIGNDGLSVKNGWVVHDQKNQKQYNQAQIVEEKRLTWYDHLRRIEECSVPMTEREPERKRWRRKFISLYKMICTRMDAITWC